MIIGLDTSVVLRLLVGQPADQADKAKQHLARAHAAGDDLVVTDPVLAEAYYALHYHYQHPKTQAPTKHMVTSGLIRIEPVACLNALEHEDGAGFVDRLILHRYRGLNASTVTFDRKLGAAGVTRW